MKSLFLITSILVATAFSMDANTMFSNQKAAAFPDSGEIRLKMVVTAPGMMPQTMDLKTLTKGSQKSVTEIRSPLVNQKIIINGNTIQTIDLNTGVKSKGMSSPMMSGVGGVDVAKLIGDPLNYLNPVQKDSLWILKPKTASGNVLYYNQNLKRIVRIDQSIPEQQGSSVVSLSYTKQGAISNIQITASTPGQADTKVSVEVLLAQKRANISDALFMIQE